MMASYGLSIYAYIVYLFIIINPSIDPSIQLPIYLEYTVQN